MGLSQFPVLHRPGWPTTAFSESSERTKRRKTEDLGKSVEVDVLTHATHIKLRSIGKRDASHVLKDIISTPKWATKYKRAYTKSQQPAEGQTKIEPLSALAMFVEAGISRRQYDIISRQKLLYPCYSVLQKAKKDCYPVKEAYKVTDTCAEIIRQSLLDHTAARLIASLEEVIQTSIANEENMTLISKWGCDGSQQVQYQQKFQNDSD